MSRQGRKKLPTEVKRLKSTLQKCRENKNEPTALRCKADPPAHLSETAKNYWITFAGILDQMRVLTVADLKQLEIYCKACADDHEFTLTLAEDGHTYEVDKIDKFGNHTGTEIKIHPLAVRVEHARDAINRYGALLGLNPADRSKLSAPRESKPEGIAGYLTNGN